MAQTNDSSSSQVPTVVRRIEVLMPLELHAGLCLRFQLPESDRRI